MEEGTASPSPPSPSSVIQPTRLPPVPNVAAVNNRAMKHYGLTDPTEHVHHRGRGETEKRG